MTMEAATIEIPDAIHEEWEVLTAGAVDVLPAEELRDGLLAAKREGRSLRVKYGADPSAPDLHLGHTVVINKLRQFQDFGHLVVFIIGDATARIGDPTGRSETRKALTVEEVELNAKTYLDQIFMILDPDKTEVVRNSQWLDPMRFSDLIALASRYTVARMLERNDFHKRYNDGRAIHIHEFLYPLVQGYDSIEVRADVELGGTDQKFNLLVGRELMREEGMPPQCILTMPLLVGLDGVNKMSKSLNNYIGIAESADEIFGKSMSIPDEMMLDYMVLTLSYHPDKAEQLMDAVKGGHKHPMELKAEIVQALAARYAGEPAAAAAREWFDAIIRDKNFPLDAELIELTTGEQGTLRVVNMVVQAGMANTNGEVRRLIAQGGVTVDGQRISDPTHELPPGQYLVKVGKRRFKQIRLN